MKLTYNGSSLPSDIRQQEGLVLPCAFSIAAIKFSVSIFILEYVGRKCDIQWSHVQLSHQTRHPSASGTESPGEEGPDTGPGGQQWLWEEHGGPAP